MSLRISKISKRIGDKWVLRDVSFDAERGEVFGLFGATMTGKSTLFQVIASLAEANSGTVENDGAKAFSTEFYAGMQQSSGGFVKRFFGKSGGEATEKAAFEQFSATYAKNPDVILLDNPFAVMSAAMRENAIQTIKQNRKNCVTLLASNNFDDIFAVCDRVAILANGEIQQIGTPQEIYESPVNATVASIVGKNNLFAARRLSSSKAELPEFVSINGEHRIRTSKFELAKLGALNQNITLAIRPEHITLAFGASFPEDNLIRAKIVSIRFYGATTMLSLDANGLALDVVVLRLVGLSVGDECMLGLPPDRILVLKD